MLRWRCCCIFGRLKSKPLNMHIMTFRLTYYIYFRIIYLLEALTCQRYFSSFVSFQRTRFSFLTMQSKHFFACPTKSRNHWLNNGKQEMTIKNVNIYMLKRCYSLYFPCICRRQHQSLPVAFYCNFFFAWNSNCPIDEVSDYRSRGWWFKSLSWNKFWKI